MSSVESKVRELVDSLSARTNHQYRSYYNRYIQWCKEKHILQNNTTNEHVYSAIPLSSILFHWFLMDILLVQQNDSAVPLDAEQEEEEEEEELGFKLATLKKIISSLRFFTKLCSIYSNPTVPQVDDKYLDSVIKLHSTWLNQLQSISRKLLTVNSSMNIPPLIKISLNLWNSNTTHLNEKIFKTDLEKLRFLVDFQFTNLAHLSYVQRSKIKLSQFSSFQNDMLYLDQIDWSSLDLVVANTEKLPKSHTPTVILSQDCPFLCPLTSLGSYLYLRFYGIPSVYGGDGFPQLTQDSSALDEVETDWTDIPLIRGKSRYDYPREETISNYYSMVFRYCQLPYKKREFFQKRQVQFPTWLESQYTQYFSNQLSKPYLKEAFKYNTPFDFTRILNYKNPYVPFSTTATNTNDPVVPHGLLVQVFPEIEEYKRHWSSLDKQKQSFITTMETIRYNFVKNLPWIHYFFPQHDLFKHSIFNKPDFQSYIDQIVSQHKFLNDSLPFNFIPGFEKFTEAEFYNVLVEPPVLQESKTITPPPIKDTAAVTTTTAATTASTKDLVDQTFQYVQFQTVSNFKMLLSLLSRIFEKLDMKKSSREYMIHQLSLVNDTLLEKINSSKPQDSSIFYDEVKKLNQIKTEEANEPPIVQKVARQEKEPRKVGLLDLASSGEESNESEEEEEEGDDDDEHLQEELQQMIELLVGQKVKAQLEQAMTDLERKISNMVESKIDAALQKRKLDMEEDRASSAKKPKNEAFPDDKLETSLFHMDKSIKTVEQVILEWFTANPQMNNECIHSMNKKYGKKWRENEETIYKERKLIVECYIYMVQNENMDRYKAVEVCEKIKEKLGENQLSSMAHFLKAWKKKHSGSFEGLSMQV